MKPEFFFQIVLTTETGALLPLQGFRCTEKQTAIKAANERLDYYSKLYPNGTVDIIEIE